MKGERENKSVIYTIQFRAGWQWEKKFLYGNLDWVKAKLPNTRNLRLYGNAFCARAMYVRILTLLTLFT